MATVQERLAAVEVHLTNQGKQLEGISQQVGDLHAYILQEKGAKIEKRRALGVSHTVSVGLGAVVGAVAGAMTAVVAVANRLYPIGTH